jgi:hypothetical protein
MSYNSGFTVAEISQRLAELREEHKAKIDAATTQQERDYQVCVAESHIGGYWKEKQAKDLRCN